MVERFSWSMPRRNDRIGRWRLHRLLGEGGNAVVWLGLEGDGSTAAIKILKPPERAERYDRFAQEVRVQVEVLGPDRNVLPLIDAHLPMGEEITVPPWLAMPVAEPLGDHLGSAPSAQQVVGALIPIAATLAGLLEQHAVSHRDIKPSNLYWFKDSPAIGDFGLVQLPDGLELTRSDRDLGPRLFLPPEMRAGEGEREGPPADVFELALTIFYFLTGDAPPGGLRADETSHQLAVRLTDPGLQDLDGVLRRATRYLPSDRLTMRELHDELIVWLDAEQPAAGTPDPANVRRRLSRINPPVSGLGAPDDAEDDLRRLGFRLENRAKPTFEYLNALGLEHARSAFRFLERLTDEALPLRSGSSLHLQPPGSDGAVWIGAGFMWGEVAAGEAHVGAVWALGSIDAPPEILWSSTVFLDPRLLAEVRRAEELIDEWAGHAQVCTERFLDQVERWAAASASPAADGPDLDPPTLEGFALTARRMRGSRRVEVIAEAVISDPIAGVAGQGYNSSPSQARFRGPAGELRDFLFSADANRVSGTRFRGFYESTVYLEPFEPDGSWEVEYVMLVDQAGHTTYVQRVELEARGFPVVIEVDRREGEAGRAPP